MTGPHEPPKGLTAALDHWASIIRNTDNLTLTDDEADDLSTLLTRAANALARRGPR